jgi:uncharacterized surface protein with fasciclin (FAS1) repeats
MMSKLKRLLLYVCLVTGINSCTKWDDHNAITDASLGKDLLQQINENTNLSKFSELLQKSGYDKVISSSQTFTVWAPTNTALASLDPAVVADTAKLRLFVGNHIATQMYSTGTTTALTRIQLLNGKFNNMMVNSFEDATITEPNKYAKNGILHIIDKAVPALANTWQTLETGAGIPARQKDFLIRFLFQKVFDATNAIQIGVNPLTGQPIYQAGTDSISTNIFWRNVYDLRNESKQYTLFILADAAWDAEVNKLKPYFATGTADSTTNLASYEVVKDLAVEGYYTAATLPDTVVSKFGIKIPVNKTAITQSIKTSNGIIHIMSALPVAPANKLRSFLIEAENYRVTSNDRRGNTYFRDRIDSTTGRPFRDVLFYNHGVSLFWANYQVTGASSVKYKAYWVAYNDFATVTHTQRLLIDSVPNTNIAATSSIPYTTVPLKNAAEVFIGEFTLPRYKPTLNLYLTGANSTAVAANPIVCDYIRLVPSP